MIDLALKISEIENPLIWNEEKIKDFIIACREMALFHQKSNSDISALYNKYQFDPNSLNSEKDLERLPYLGVTAMKYFLFTSLPESKAVLKLTSSGTRGQKTQIWFDEVSLHRVQRMLDVLWKQEGLVSEVPTNYVNFIYDPEQAKDLGISFSVKNEERFAPAKSSFFAVRKDTEGNWEFKYKDTLQQLLNCVEEGDPVRVLGIPSFIFELLQRLKKEGIKIKLPNNSFMLTGGGWKAAEDKSVTREEFRQMVGEYLGIPDENIRDGYGMAEHSAPYIECKKHKFHIPVYNRILVREPVNLNILKAGEAGLLEFITPFNSMMPNLAILSTDLGYVDIEPCSCGVNAPTFTLVGRGGLTKHKGCAITANEIVRRK